MHQKENAPLHKNAELSASEHSANTTTGFVPAPLDSRQPVTMTSLEVVDFINEQRKEGEAVLRHDNFMAKVPLVLGEDCAPKFSGTQPYGNNNTRAIYRFPKREACLMAMSYSYELQAKVFDHMTALEAQQALGLPNFADPVAAARAWADAKEGEQKAVALLALVKPKVIYADAMLNADGTVLVRDAAKTIGVPVRLLEKALRDKGVILPGNGPSAKYVTQGYLVESLAHYDTNTRGRQISRTTRVTGKGLEFLRRFAQRHADILTARTKKVAE